ncbi:MAG: hypothetical protein LC799_09840 [Actinobacteria bacterium]|nr:hypothetical protein [Actinomycetota bacterium]
MGMPGFEQAGAQMAGLRQQQTDLQRAVAAGELWMEAGVAEAAASRCQQAVEEIDRWFVGAGRLAQKLPFGDNQDGHRVAQRYAQAGEEFIAAMRGAQEVIKSMAITFQAAGRTVAEADAAGEQQFRGRP